MSKVALKYTKAEVDAAGRTISDHPDDETLDFALEIVNNFRASHGFPLNTFKLTLRRNALALDKDALVAQRIKRLPAIVDKLERLPLKLSEFQDIAGCRAVLQDVQRVRALRAKYTNSKNLRHTLVRENDYIAMPRKTGYRSIHLIWSYKSDKNQEHDGFSIEMQIRSRTQHAWATSVETVTMMTGEPLKSGRGDPRWLRLFALMGTAMATREGEPIVPGTPLERAARRAELRALNTTLDAKRRLEAYTEALKFTQPENGEYFLLKLTPASERLEIQPFAKKDRAKAEKAYEDLERLLFGKPGSEVVLVSVDSAKLLRAAFPNYYLDTQMFVRALQTEIA